MESILRETTKLQVLPVSTEVADQILERPKEKSWSIRIDNGYFSDNLGLVRTNGCGDCKSSPSLMAINLNNPRLILLGCRDRKCQHKLVRLET